MVATQFAEITEFLGVYVNELLLNENFLLFLYFFSVLVITFTLFKGIFRLMPTKNIDMKDKETNVISFFLSLIGTSGLFWLINENSIDAVEFFGIYGSLFLVTVLIIAMLRNLYTFAKEEGNGPYFFFLMAIGIYLSLVILFTLFSALDDKYSSMLGLNSEIWAGIFPWIFAILFFLLPILAIWGILMLVSHITGGDEDGNHGGSSSRSSSKRKKDKDELMDDDDEDLEEDEDDGEDTKKLKEQKRTIRTNLNRMYKDLQEVITKTSNRYNDLKKAVVDNKLDDLNNISRIELDIINQNKNINVKLNELEKYLQSINSDSDKVMETIKSIYENKKKQKDFYENITTYIKELYALLQEIDNYANSINQNIQTTLNSQGEDRLVVKDLTQLILSQVGKWEEFVNKFGDTNKKLFNFEEIENTQDLEVFIQKIIESSNKNLENPILEDFISYFNETFTIKNFKNIRTVLNFYHNLSEYPLAIKNFLDSIGTNREDQTVVSVYNNFIMKKTYRKDVPEDRRLNHEEILNSIREKLNKDEDMIKIKEVNENYVSLLKKIDDISKTEEFNFNIKIQGQGETNYNLYAGLIKDNVTNLFNQRMSQKETNFENIMIAINNVDLFLDIVNKELITPANGVSDEKKDIIGTVLYVVFSGLINADSTDRYRPAEKDEIRRKIAETANQNGLYSRDIKELVEIVKKGNLIFGLAFGRTNHGGGVVGNGIVSLSYNNENIVKINFGREVHRFGLNGYNCALFDKDEILKKVHSANVIKVTINTGVEENPRTTYSFDFDLSLIQTNHQGIFIKKFHTKNPEFCDYNKKQKRGITIDDFRGEPEKVKKGDFEKKR